MRYFLSSSRFLPTAAAVARAIKNKLEEEESSVAVVG
jgi:hypothetical protein